MNKNERNKTKLQFFKYGLCNIKNITSKLFSYSGLSRIRMIIFNRKLVTNCLQNKSPAAVSSSLSFVFLLDSDEESLSPFTFEQFVFVATFVNISFDAFSRNWKKQKAYPYSGSKLTKIYFERERN